MSQNLKKFIIAIDGGAATGKSSLSKAISKKLNIAYLDTGSLYRAITLYYIENNIELNDENVLKNLDNIEVSVENVNSENVVYLNGKDVTSKLHENIVSNNVSLVSKIPEVRKKILNLQRDSAKEKSIVVDGRDIGTVVFPDADVKLFLVASLEKRAIRRKEDLKNGNENVDEEKLQKELAKRDEQDSTRKVSPLKKADDAFEIDTTFTTVDEALEKALEIIRTRIDV